MDPHGCGGEGAAPHTGTTILAVVYDGGVVLGADSRVSTGTYISNRASDKIASLTDNVYLLRSGSAADTQIVSDHGEGGRGRGIAAWGARQTLLIHHLAPPLPPVPPQCTTTWSST